MSDAVLNYGADPEGVIFMGFSNGGFMSHRMACDRGSLMKAIVALNGVTWNDFSMCPNTGTLISFMSMQRMMVRLNTRAATTTEILSLARIPPSRTGL